MDEFYYDYIKNIYGNKWRLLFTDTFSLIYEVKTEEFYEDFSKDKGMFDFSYYSAKSKHYDDSNKLVASKIKDETSGVAIEEFVWLNRKWMLKFHSIIVDDSSEHKKAKGINKNAVARIGHKKCKCLEWFNKYNPK